MPLSTLDVLVGVVTTDPGGLLDGLRALAVDDAAEGSGLLPTLFLSAVRKEAKRRC